MQSVPFTGFYSQKLRESIRVLPDRWLRLYVALSTYSDARGTCFPGLRELSAQTGLNLHEVREGLDALAESGFIAFLRRGERDEITRRQLPDVYALNPALLVVSEPLQGVSFGAHGKKPDSILPSTGIHNQNQETESKAEPNEAESVTTTTNQTPAKRGEAAAGAGEAKSKSKSAKQSQSAAQTSAAQNSVSQPNSAERSPFSPLPPSSHAGDEPDDLTAYNEPLSDPGHEAAAVEMYREVGNMSHATARMLIDVYGEGRARAAVRMLRAQKTPVANPGGYVRSMLRKRAVAADDLKQVFDFSEYVNV